MRGLIWLAVLIPGRNVSGNYFQRFGRDCKTARFHACSHWSEPELELAETALRGDYIGRQDADRLAAKVETFIGALPSDFGSRFLFDSAMIRFTCDEWSQQGTSFSALLMPLLAEEWGHLTVTYARHGKKSVPVDLILFPGGPNLEAVDLLGYPFLCHELGHNVLFRHDNVFEPRFQVVLDEYSHSLQIRAMADRGSARLRSQRQVDALRGYWGPTPDHNNWSHEIAVDVIALWTCGPAYLATFQDILEVETLNPYQIDQSHPPYEVRSTALLYASNKLGWASYTDGIRCQIHKWHQSERARTNSYLTNTNPDLTHACVDIALGSCEALGLPNCTPASVRDLTSQLEGDWTPDFGIELLLAAWLRRRQLGEDGYIAWEKWIKESLYSSVRL